MADSVTSSGGSQSSGAVREVLANGDEQQHSLAPLF